MQAALAAMLDLHEQLSTIGEEPVPYHESDWEQLKASLPDRITQRRMFGTGRVTRPLIAATMAVGLTAGAAAASPAVRERMVSVWHGIQRVALVGDPSGEQRRPSITSPIVPGAHAGTGTSDSAGNSDGTPGGGNSGEGGGNSGGGNWPSGQLRRHARRRKLRQPGRRQLRRSRQIPGNPGEAPGNSDGTPGGGNTGSPGNSDGTPGGGNSGEGGGNSGGGNSGGPGNSDGTPGGGNSGEGGGNSGGGNSAVRATPTAHPVAATPARAAATPAAATPVRIPAPPRTRRAEETPETTPATPASPPATPTGPRVAATPARARAVPVAASGALDQPLSRRLLRCLSS